MNKLALSEYVHYVIDFDIFPEHVVKTTSCFRPEETIHIGVKDRSSITTKW